MPRQTRSVRLSVAAQLLALQVVLFVGVLTAVLWLSVSQSLRDFTTQEGQRTLVAAEALAATPLVRTLLPEVSAADESALFTAVEAARSAGALTEALVMSVDGRVLATSDSSPIGRQAPAELLTGELGRAWTGTVTVDSRELLISRVPVYAEDGAQIGAVVAARAFPGWPERLSAALPDLLVTLVMFAVIGFGGSYLLSRRLKRQTLGMEPGEIARLVEHRDALLHGVKEGVIAVDNELRITVLNDAARDLLNWQDIAVGTPLDPAWVAPELLSQLRPQEAAVAGTPSSVDAPVVVGSRLLVANRRPIFAAGKQIGAVTTLRDRTELIALRSELNASRTTTDLLRAQTHEFANQLHTVSGLIQSDEQEEALRFIFGVATSKSAMLTELGTRIEDPPLAALLIAKATAAAEHQVHLRVDEEAQLSPVDQGLSHALITVAGNLIDNAIDAVTGAPTAEVNVDVSDTDGVIRVTVLDSGAGLHGRDPDQLFERGFSTKATRAIGGRGYGLALTRQICRSYAGEAVAEDTGDGAVFTAVLKRKETT